MFVFLVVVFLVFDFGVVYDYFGGVDGIDVCGCCLLDWC